MLVTYITYFPWNLRRNMAAKYRRHFAWHDAASRINRDFYGGSSKWSFDETGESEELN